MPLTQSGRLSAAVVQHVSLGLDRIPGVAKGQCKKGGFRAVKDRSDPITISAKAPKGMIGDAAVTCRSRAMLTGRITANQNFIIRRLCTNSAWIYM